MWFDETPRLFSVADMLQKKKNKDDNYEFDDIPDVKKQELTGKYDKNFDALGSDFERAHNYNLNNIQQPENTKSDVEYSDKYSNFFKYEPSTYVKLEEDEYKPFSKNDEKANEYYIDNLQGKTLDDLVISKMKQNAGAVDLPRDAMRRQFAEDLIRNEPELPNSSRILQRQPEPIIVQNRAKQALQRVNGKYAVSNVVIDAPLSNNLPPHPKPVRQSNRLQGLSAPNVPFSPENRKGPTQPKDIDAQEEGGGGISGAHREEVIKKQRGAKQLLDILGKADENKVKEAFEKWKVPKKTTTKKDENAENIDSGGSGGGAKSGGNNKGAKKDEKHKKDDNKDEKDENKGGGKPLTKDEAREERARHAQARLEQQEEERIKSLSNQKRVEVYRTLIPKLEQYTSDKQLESEDWLTYQGLMKFHKHKTGNIPKASTAVKNLQEKLTESIKSLESSVNQDKLQRIQEAQTLAGNKLAFSSDLKTVKSTSKTPRTPVEKVKESEVKRPQSPSETNRKTIEGIISHHNPQTGKK